MKNVGAGILLVLLAAWACKPENVAKPILTEQVHDQRCRSVLKRIPEDNVVVQNENWEYAFNVLLVVCVEDLDSITPAQEQAIVQLSTREIKREGFQIVAEVEDMAFREELRSSINALVGKQIASDAYINILFAGESM